MIENSIDKLAAAMERLAAAIEGQTGAYCEVAAALDAAPVPAAVKAAAEKAVKAAAPAKPAMPAAQPAAPAAQQPKPAEPKCGPETAPAAEKKAPAAEAPKAELTKVDDDTALRTRFKTYVFKCQADGKTVADAQKAAWGQAGLKFDNATAEQRAVLAANLAKLGY